MPARCLKNETAILAVFLSQHSAPYKAVNH